MLEFVAEVRYEEVYFEAAFASAVVLVTAASAAAAEPDKATEHFVAVAVALAAARS